MIRSHTVELSNNKEIVIYAETPNINYFLGVDLEPDEDGGVINKQVQRPGGVRRKYPGGPAISYKGGNRQVLIDPTRKSGTALPGHGFVLQEILPPTSEEKPERRQFSFKGRVLDLHAFLTGHADRDFYFFTHRKARYTIQKVD